MTLKLLYNLKNLDGTNSWRCQACGWKGKFSEEPTICPNCGENENKVESIWTTKRTDGNIPIIRCSLCNSRMIETPRSGHPNSEFWNNEIYHNEVLLSCPNGCTKNNIFISLKKRTLLHTKQEQKPVMLMRKR